MKNEMDRRSFMKGIAMGGVGAGITGAAATAAQAQDADAAPVTAVPRKQLGTTGETIPIIFMGGSRTFDMKYDKTLHRAHKLGIDYVDTAESYASGQSQKGVAVFQQQIGRENVWITTKVEVKEERSTPEGLKKGLDDCLADLQTDYVNMFFMHMIRDERYLDADFIKAGDDMRKSGKTKFFGFSCHHGNVPQMISKAARAGGIDAIMFRYNFRQYGDVELNKAMDEAKAAGIGLLAMKTQGSVPEDSEKVAEFQSKSFSLPQAKLKTVWSDERIDGCVSGMDNIQILEENATAAISPAQLTMNEFHQLNRLARLTAPYACLGCNQICESRIDGKLKVADALRYLMYHECYGDPETARLLYNALDLDERDFDRVDLAEAIKACPQGIRIDERLRKARSLLTA
jgi:predicted aldo/keto reductase-like oxidoreductase